MLRLINACLFLCIFGVLQAQNQEILYDLDSYKQVDFRLIGLNASPFGSFRAADQFNVPGVSPGLTVTGGLSLVGFQSINTLDQQSSATFSVDATLSESRFLSASVDGVVRNYYELDKYWIHTPQMAVIYSEQRGPNVPIDQRRVDGGYGIGLGFGRIENVGQARTAVVLLQTLAGRNLLVRDPTVDDVTNFADVIGTLEGSRIFDDRLRSIAIIEKITNHLISAGLLRESSITTTLLIEDAYTFDRVIDRFSGSSFEMTLNTDLLYIYSEVINQDLRVMADVNFEGMLNWTRYDNMDVHWMRRVAGFSSLRYSDFNAGDFSDFIAQRDNITGTLGGTYGYSYTPNLRNRYSLFVNSAIALPYELDPDKDHFFNEATFFANVSGSYNHYFSPRTQVAFSTLFIYRDQEFQAGTFSPSLDLQANFQVLHALY